jgi:hypothetical protein
MILQNENKQVYYLTQGFSLGRTRQVFYVWMQDPKAKALG